jgi:hypothetical protein
MQVGVGKTGEQTPSAQIKHPGSGCVRAVDVPVQGDDLSATD